MEGGGCSIAAEAVIETLRTRGWCIGDVDQVKALIIIQSALSDDDDTSAVADSVESEMLNMDLKSIGAKSLPDANLLHKTSHLQGPKVLQISSVRDISVSSMEGFSDSSNRRLLRFTLTDGHSEITAIEYSHIPSIPNDIVPGTKVRLESKVLLHSGIACLNPKVITIIGGVVRSLHEEWQVNQKYSGLSRSSLRSSQEPDNGGPPPFEKLQLSAPFHQSSLRGKPADYFASTSKSSVPTAANAQLRLCDTQQKGDHTDDKKRKESLNQRIGEGPRLKEGSVFQSHLICNEATAQKHIQNMGHLNQNARGKMHGGKDKDQEPWVLTLGNTIDHLESNSKYSMPTAMEASGTTGIRQIDIQQSATVLDDKVTTTSSSESIERKPSSSETRVKEVAESVPVQNQAAAQKLLQKMSSPSQGDRHYRGRKHKGKGKQEEMQVFTLDEWEKRKTGTKPPRTNDLPDTSYDEDLAWQLQNQLDMGDSNVQMRMHNKAADDIRMSMFNYERDADKVHGMEYGGGERGFGRGRGRGRGQRRGRGRGRYH